MNDLEVIAKELNEKIVSADSIEKLEELKVQALGRKGIITEILRSLSNLPLEERKTAGEKANTLKKEIETALDSKIKELRTKMMAKSTSSEKADTSPALAFPFDISHKHPLKKTLDEIIKIFKSLGFSIAEGPEIETDWYNFEALNIPKDHPARDVQDTFYLEGMNKLLRTHTSPVQIHVMEKQKPPVKVIVPGRVFRN